MDPDGHQETVSDRLTLPTDGVASRVLSVVSQAREISNNIVLGPIGAKVSDAAASALDRGLHEFNKATYGPLGDTVNAIQDNPTVQVAGLAAAVIGGIGGGKATAGSKGAYQAKEIVYEFPDAKAPGLTYVGESKRGFAVRGREHVSAGKLDPASAVTITPTPGGKTTRLVAEQSRINELGGTRSVPGSRTSNIRNPISPKKWKQHGIE